MTRQLFATGSITMALLLSPLLVAGTWGDGKWGQMYWGSNPESAPQAAPSVTATADGEDLILALNNLTTPAQTGWSVITHFLVTCGNNPTVTVSAANPVMTGLEPDTQYNCTIVAVNDEGSSATGQFTATTDSLSNGLPIWLLYQATQHS